MDDRIRLDKEVFRALSSETRINILKSLDQRRKTLNELSGQLGLSPSTVKEHLQLLVETGLIELKDDGHKWKYYELSRLGKRILKPGERNVWMILSIAVAAFLGVLYNTVVRHGPAGLRINDIPPVAAPGIPYLPEAAADISGIAGQAAATAGPPLPLLNAVLMTLFAGIALLCLARIINRRRSGIISNR